MQLPTEGSAAFRQKVLPGSAAATDHPAGTPEQSDYLSLQKSLSWLRETHPQSRDTTPGGRLSHGWFAGRQPGYGHHGRARGFACLSVAYEWRTGEDRKSV